jgi:hypothetical protein
VATNSQTGKEIKLFMEYESVTQNDLLIKEWTL